ncbi:MAG: hypothetical protein LC105_13365 [Chitinophagales bacterium]|nr:hypothetical protein [Chitinophagales bacterium]MCZ2394846.1 hypothetical protein [Chitinophagales bacterium]
MNKYKIPKIITIFIGILMLAVGIAITYFNTVITGPLAEGFFTPIIALEFMNNTNDLASFFDIATVKHLKASLLIGNQIDYAFMTLYGLFAAFVGILIYLETRVKALWISIPLVILIVVSDVFENLNIAEILTIQEFQNANLLLEQLQIFTWLKWGGLSALMLLFSVYFIQGNWWKILMGIFLVSSIGFYFSAYYLRGIYCEIFAMSIMFNFLLLFIFTILWRHPREGFNI